MNRPESPQTLQVLSPWSDIDAITLQQPAPRLDGLAGKKLGLFANFKRASEPMLRVAESWLRERYPDLELSWYRPRSANVPELQGPGREAFESWVDGQDGVLLAVGD